MSTLDVRRQGILEAIIHCHTLTAQPVGSRVLSKRYELGLSAATIRNAMADLEEMGLVMQPHTSAGRVPTENGYRYYVDRLMEVADLPATEKSGIWQSYREACREFENLMEQTTRILSSLSHYIGIVMSPSLHTKLIKRLEVFKISDDQLLAVLVIEPGIIRNRVIPRGGELLSEDLVRINNALNARLVGRSLLELQELAHHPAQLRAFFDQQVFEEVTSLLRDVVDIVSEPQVYLQGHSNIFAQPEFGDLDRTEAVFKILEQKEQLPSLLGYSPGMRVGVSVRIGSENNCEEMQACSVISAAYVWNQRPLGVMGVIGPTRMEYARVMSLVEYTAKVMSQVIRNQLA